MPEIYYKRKTPSGVVAPPWMHPVWVEWKYLSPSSAPKLLRCAPNVLRNYWISGRTNTLTDTVSCKSGYNYLRSLVDRYHPIVTHWCCKYDDFCAPGILKLSVVLRKCSEMIFLFRSTFGAHEQYRSTYGTSHLPRRWMMTPENPEKDIWLIECSSHSIFPIVKFDIRRCHIFAALSEHTKIVSEHFRST